MRLRIARKIATQQYGCHAWKSARRWLAIRRVRRAGAREVLRYWAEHDPAIAELARAAFVRLARAPRR